MAKDTNELNTYYPGVAGTHKLAAETLKSIGRFSKKK